ncbi:MAG: DUF2252 family protein, partial [Asticcacaulis sp.]|nr:DUF2252 family protein [Asticcacaulis sp.]
MSIVEDSDAYEAWLRTHCQVVEDALADKHERMAGDIFMFFRATCFRFARKFAKWFPDLVEAPLVPSIGDAHIENFGTWRDAEGRLVWGVNDFDEAAVLPWTCDLVRLAASARLGRNLPGTNRSRTTALLEGYMLGLLAPTPQFVDDERPWLQTLVTRPGKAGDFQYRLGQIKQTPPPPTEVQDLLRAAFLGDADIKYMGNWKKGGGSLGRPRHVAVGRWQGGPAVREAKALVPSAWSWGANYATEATLFEKLASGPYRSPDPFLTVKVSGKKGSAWVVRRIAPDSVKIDLGDAGAETYNPLLLSAMGRELASIHVTGDVAAATILADLNRHPVDWLLDAARDAEKQVAEDF